MSNRRIDRETQLILLANWIEGRHREDFILFDEALFNYRDLYQAAKNGDKSLMELVAAGKSDGLRFSEIYFNIHINGLSVGTLEDPVYIDARIDALKTQREALKDDLIRYPEKMTETVDRLLDIQAILNNKEIRPAAANLADAFFREMEEQNAAKKMRLGKGFERLDRKLGSIRKGQLVVLAGRPATGKSAAALQIAYNIASTGAKVLFLPLEMTTQETLERLLIQQDIVENKAALIAMSEDEKIRTKEFLDGIENAGTFLIYEGVNNLEAIMQLIKEQRPDLVVIDQLTQVRTAKKTSDIRERYIEITAELKAAALKENTAILLLSQLNRLAADKKITKLEQLHESDATGQNADIAILIGTESDEEGNRKNEVYLNIAKNRSGESGTKIRAIFLGHKYRFSNCEKE